MTTPYIHDLFLHDWNFRARESLANSGSINTCRHNETTSFQISLFLLVLQWSISVCLQCYYFFALGDKRRGFSGTALIIVVILADLFWLVSINFLQFITLWSPKMLPVFNSQCVLKLTKTLIPPPTGLVRHNEHILLSVSNKSDNIRKMVFDYESVVGYSCTKRTRRSLIKLRMVNHH